MPLERELVGVESRDEIKVAKFNGRCIQSAFVCDQTNAVSSFVG